MAPSAPPKPLDYRPTISTVAADDAVKPKYTVKEVMEKAHKGATPQDNNNTLYAKVQSGRFVRA